MTDAFEKNPRALRDPFIDASRDKPKAAPRVTLRLSEDEHGILLDRAEGETISAYIRACLFGEAETKRKRPVPRPLEDRVALAKVLGELGKSRLASNLNQLARAANSGSLPVTEDTEIALREACRDIGRMRRDLVAALGLKAGLE